jgi:uncharacterized glyoxalase superfamily protein PhnB
MGVPHQYRATLSAAMSYRDAPAAIEWLCNALGFEKKAVYPEPGGLIAHAELTFGNGMLMLGSKRDNEFGRLMRHPDEIGRGNTHCVNLIAADPDAICARVKAHGGEILQDIEDKPYGGRGFTCRDPEGYLWHVGSYDPWQTT